MDAGIGSASDRS